MREREPGATLLRYRPLASIAPYSSADFSIAAASIAATPPRALIHLKVRPAM